MVSFGIALKSCYYIFTAVMRLLTRSDYFYSFCIEENGHVQLSLWRSLYMNLVVTAYKGRYMSNYILYTVCIYVLLLLFSSLVIPDNFDSNEPMTLDSYNSSQKSLPQFYFFWLLLRYMLLSFHSLLLQSKKKRRDLPDPMTLCTFITA